MPSYLRALPDIRWGASLANTLLIGYPLDEVHAGDEPRAASEWTQAPSGVEEAWITGTDYVLSFSFRWIPQVDSASPAATGWDGSTGVRAFLAWARNKNPFTFTPDHSTPGTTITNCYLVDPMQGQPDPEDDGTRKLVMKIRNASTPFDGY